MCAYIASCGFLSNDFIEYWQRVAVTGSTLWIEESPGDKTGMGYAYKSKKRTTGEDDPLKTLRHASPVLLLR